MTKPVAALLALALAGGVWAAVPDAPRRPKLASPAFMMGASPQGSSAERCLTPAAGLPESLRVPAEAHMGAEWAPAGPGKWLHPAGVEVPTLADRPGVVPEFGFHGVSPRADEVVAAKPTVVVVNVWKNLAPGWCVHGLEARLDGEPAAAAALDDTGRLTVPLPADLAPGVHGVTVFVEACCGQPQDFVRTVPVRVGHHQVFTWQEEPPKMRVVGGGAWRLRVAFSGQAPPSAADPAAWEVRDPLTGGLLQVKVSEVARVAGSRDLLISFAPALPNTQVVLALRWQDQECVASYLPPIAQGSPGSAP